MAVITLLTDFGLSDTYVGQVKGVILAIAHDARLVDLTHAVPPQDVQAGAFLLWSAVEAFAAGTVHLAVVDPGVGSARRTIAVRSHRGDLFVGPDNGLLVPAVARLGGTDLAVELTNERYWRPSPSRTFHGRDIFGPVAARLASGVPLEAVGQPISDIKQLSFPEPRGLAGEVIHVDAFGNLVTNLAADRVPARFHVTLEGHPIGAAPHYQAVKPGELLALVGSAGLLEISARDASAAKLTGATRGTPVRVEPL
jgi:S-adenosyl-L-methionine hydrolase (adenosine-forming)